MTKEIHKCECEICRTQSDPDVMHQHQQMNLLLNRVNEPQRRWYVDSLSQQPGQPTDGQLNQITGLDEKTIRHGWRELGTELAELSAERQRQAGGRRSRAEKKTLNSK